MPNEKTEPGPPRHEPVENPDLPPLQETAAKYLAYLRGPGADEAGARNGGADVLAAAMSCLYGLTVWEEINALLAAAYDGNQKK